MVTDVSKDSSIFIFRGTGVLEDFLHWVSEINPLTPNDPYKGRTAPLNFKRCILYIYSSNIGTEYFEQGIYSPFFLFKMQFHNSNVFGSLLFTFYIQVCQKFKKNLAPKG